MATSISKAQSDALAAGFFDSLGSSKNELTPKHSLSALYQLAGGLVDEAQKNLNTADRVSTGALSKSMKVLNPEKVGTTIRLDIEALFYYQFIDQGVKGTKGGSGKFSFQNYPPGKKMMVAIRKWLIREGLKAKTNTYKPITKREVARRSISNTSNSAAYAIATSIKQKGLKRTNFFSKAVRTTKSKAISELSAGFKIDIINSIPKNLDQA